jgi:hypothetical protein
MNKKGLLGDFLIFILLFAAVILIVLIVINSPNAYKEQLDILNAHIDCNYLKTVDSTGCAINECYILNNLTNEAMQNKKIQCDILKLVQK